jgi:hypothetical protein
LPVATFDDRGVKKKNSDFLTARKIHGSPYMQRILVRLAAVNYRTNTKTDKAAASAKREDAEHQKCIPNLRK